MDITGTATNMKAAGMAAQADYQSVISQYTSNVAINVSGTADCLAGGIIGYGELNANISNCYVSPMPKFRRMLPMKKYNLTQVA